MDRKLVTILILAACASLLLPLSRNARAVTTEADASLYQCEKWAPIPWDTKGVRRLLMPTALKGGEYPGTYTRGGKTLDGKFIVGQGTFVGLVSEPGSSGLTAQFVTPWNVPVHFVANESSTSTTVRYGRLAVLPKQTQSNYFECSRGMAAWEAIPNSPVKLAAAPVTSTPEPAARVEAPSIAPATLPSTSPPALPAFGERRVALVIGNSNYLNVPKLTNPERDANAIAEALRRVGFQSVTLQINTDRDKLQSALRDFARLADTADWAVVYYAGHGMEIGGMNYLIPIDAKIKTDRDIGFEAVPLDQVLNAAERAGKLRLLLLDACRDNPFASQMKRTLTIASRSVSRGLAQVEPDAGTLVVYAAKHGEIALDGDGNNSPFATAFIRNLSVPGVEVRRMFDNIRDDVLDATGRRQQPFSYGSITGRQDFYFVAGK